MSRNNTSKTIFQIIIFLFIIGFIAATFLSMDDSMDDAETKIEKLTDVSDIDKAETLKDIKKIITSESIGKYTEEELHQKFSDLQ